MIGSPAPAVEKRAPGHRLRCRLKAVRALSVRPLTLCAANMLLAVSKDGPDGLLESGRARDTFLLLGDASRGALYLALRPAASNGESPSPPPPERRAPSDPYKVNRRVPRCAGRARP